MAIRPTDIQSSIWQSAQNAPLAQHGEEGPRAAQVAAQAAFANHLEERNERVAESAKGEGNRVDANAERQAGQDAGSRERRAANAFAETVDEAAGLDEPPHLIDFTA